MQFLGSQFIGFTTSKLGEEMIYGVNPESGEKLEPGFAVATLDEVDRAVTRASHASARYRSLSAEARAEFLERIADEIEGLGDELIERCTAETGLPEGRITGERGRTCGQLRLFAQVVKEGSWVDARIDRAMPDREPLPKPDLRRMLVGLGPVGVFGASNFPLAFSTAGGDTASALAAGCPVVVKAHPAHPGTAEMVAQAIMKACVATGMPDGVFSMVHGGAEVGKALVEHPELKAVGFTGSHQAGRALFDAAAKRPEPIPVFAEMGSINPVFVLPGSASDADWMSDGIVASLLLGVGQFCTNPGLIVGVAGDELNALRAAIAPKIAKGQPGVMLTEGIAKNFAECTKRLKGHEGVKVDAEGSRAEGHASGSGVVFRTDAETFMKDQALGMEVFGPATMIVECSSFEEMQVIAFNLEGQLTATVHTKGADVSQAAALSEMLQDRVGRIVFDGYPTGVEVCPSMMHGGPYPAATDSRYTSVGTAAIYRFARPVCWQSAPAEVLPVELQDSNSRNVWRLVDGVRTKDSV